MLTKILYFVQIKSFNIFYLVRCQIVQQSSDLPQGSQVDQARGGRSVGAYRDVPADQLSYIEHGALVDKRRQRKSPYKSGDFPESNMNDDSLILQTCLSRRVSGDSKNQQV